MSDRERHEQIHRGLGRYGLGARLDAVVVRYECRPDRRTLSPAGKRATGSAWLTAGVGAFVDLDDAR